MTDAAASFPGAVQFDVTAKVSGRAYRIFVYQPPVPAPPAGYPVVMLSDGNINFLLAAAMGRCSRSRASRRSWSGSATWPKNPAT